MYHYLARISKKLLPDWLYERLIGDWDKQGLKKYLQNTSWLAVAKIVSLVASFITIAIVARYLGPENYGKLSYAQSFVALISVLASLGIDQILYRDLVAHPEKEAEILGTAFFSKLFLGLFTIIVAYILVLTLNLEPVLSLLILIITCSFIVQPFGVIANVFAARVKSKYTIKKPLKNWSTCNFYLN